MDRVKTLRWLNYALTGLIASHRRVRQDAKHNVAPLGLVKLIPPTRHNNKTPKTKTTKKSSVRSVCSVDKKKRPAWLSKFYRFYSFQIYK